MIAATFHRLGRDRRGATIIEFALILPVMLTLIMGLSELSYQGYVQSVLTGAIQKAGRNSAIQGANTSQIDAAVMQQVWTVAKTATYTSSRKSYSNFINVGPEPFTDTAGTGVYNSSQDCFTDLNGNGTWDSDPGASGQGGANDVTVYAITVTYPRLFPVSGVIGFPNPATIGASTTLKNQPYGTQTSYTPTQICPHH